MNEKEIDFLIHFYGRQPFHTLRMGEYLRMEAEHVDDGLKIRLQT